MTGCPPLSSAKPVSSANEPSTAVANLPAPMGEPKEASAREVMQGGRNNANGAVNHLHSAEISGKKLGWGQSRSFNIAPKRDMALEDTESPRYQEILRLTNGDGHKKKTTFKKSFSLPAQVGDVKSMIRQKFYRTKEEVNALLEIFCCELMIELKQVKESNPEWQKHLEDLLNVARQSAKMSAEEFWSECEKIVLEVDHDRHELPEGMSKQTHTRLLFILTQCTRIVQCDH